MVYNLNLGIGWASSGVEYAQLYRARMFRNAGIPAKFIFTDMFSTENIEHMTENIGLYDSEVEWLYTFFTDTKISKVTFTLEELTETFPKQKYTITRDKKKAKCVFDGTDIYYTIYFVNETDNLVHRVEMVSKNCLVRKDYYTYCRIYTEYFAPLDNKAHLYQRRFYNEDGSVCYEEVIDGERVMYRFAHRILDSKEELVGYMLSQLNLTKDDVVLIDRTTGIGQAILQNARPARIGSIIHADHFSEAQTNDDTILWNNYYEYIFSQHKHVDFYISSTEAQSRLLREQMKKYWNVDVNAITIPVGSISELKYPEGQRKPYSLITASRLASEKHVDWIVEAVLKAKEVLPELTLDIYGKGGAEAALAKRIEEKNAGGYIRLCGQQNLTEVYKNYEAYISASTGEGFGLTLLEAVGSGLPLIGFDVRYGNPTFIDHEKNGYLIPVNDTMEGKERTEKLSACILKLFTEADLDKFHAHSYEKAMGYLTEEVEKKWKEII